MDSVETKFKVGQVVMWERGGSKRAMPLVILGAVREFGQWYYKVDRKNCLAEHMLRPLTSVESGDSLLAAERRGAWIKVTPESMPPITKHYRKPANTCEWDESDDVMVLRDAGERKRVIACCVFPLDTSRKPYFADWKGEVVTHVIAYQPLPAPPEEVEP